MCTYGQSINDVSCSYLLIYQHFPRFFCSFICLFFPLAWPAGIKNSPPICLFHWSCWKALFCLYFICLFVCLFFQIKLRFKNKQRRAPDCVLDFHDLISCCIFMNLVLLFRCGESAPKEEIYHVFSLDIPTL